MQPKENREETMKKNVKSFYKIWNTKYSNVCMTGVPGDNRERIRKNIPPLFLQINSASLLFLGLP